MLKLLRKHKQWFLAAFGVLLLVTFLFTGTSAMFRPDPGKTVVATVGDEPVIAAEADLAQKEFETLRRLAPATLLFELGVENATHWQLLVREARRAGLVADSGDGADWLSNELPETEATLTLALDYQRQGFPPQLIMQLISQPSLIQPRIEERRNAMQMLRPTLAADARMTLEQFDQVVARMRAVSRLVGAYQSAARLSDRRTIAAARRVLESVEADVLLISADRLEPDAPEPDEDAIARQYEAYRDKKPGEGEYGFGYVQPPRVKIEYLELSRSAISASITLDPIEVHKFYQQRRSEFPGEFAAEKSRVEARLRETRIDEILNQWDSIYKSRIKAALRGIPVSGGLYILPNDWESRRPSMEALASDITSAVAEATGVRLPSPTVVVRSKQWTRLDRVHTIPGLGQAQFASGRQRLPLPAFLGTLYELAGEAMLGFQSRVPFEHHLDAPGGNRYYVCVLDWRGESAPDSLDDVRDDVRRDIRMLWAYEQLASRVTELRARCVAEGLEAVGKSFARPGDKDGTAPVAPVEPVRTVRISRVNAGMGRIPEIDEEIVRTQVMDAAERLGMLTPPTPESLEARTLAFHLPKALSVAIIQITYPTPMTLEDMRSIGRNTYQTLLRMEVSEVAPGSGNPFSYDALVKRLRYEAKGGRDVGVAPADKDSSSR
jgi:hypothetical protein